MFVGYENFSTFFVDADDMAASELGSEFACFPNELKPRFPIPDPWFAASACSGDFIVVAEFSELEGPVPRVSAIVCAIRSKCVEFTGCGMVMVTTICLQDTYTTQP